MIALFILVIALDASTVTAPTSAAERAWLAGRDAYNNLLFEEAATQVATAITLWQHHPPPIERWRDFGLALLYAARISEAVGDTLARERWLDAFVRLDPPVTTTDLTAFPPEFRNELARRRAAQPAKSGALRIETDPPGANVFLNGRWKGESPIVLQGLAGGKHVIDIRKPGFFPQTRAVEITPGFGVGAEATPDLLEMRLTPITPKPTARMAVPISPARPSSTTLSASQPASRAKYWIWGSVGVLVAGTATAIAIAASEPEAPRRGSADIHW